ncbi:putative phage tail protein [Oceanobacillus sp. CF4.6]|uniref:putative phage tail protein n=1 Tax=Oceanobacillus sp. CF4.6 TaxID=3373080 RepID=UPI003EE46878
MNEQKLLEMLPPYFGRLKQMKEIARVEGIQFNKLDEDMDDLLNQAFVQTATWGLSYWEQQYMIPVLHESEDYAYRRRRIMTAKRSSKADLIEILRAIEPMLELAWGGNVLPFTIESDADYYEFGELVRVLESEKPSHLNYSFSIKPNGYTIKADHRSRFEIGLRLISGTAKSGRYPRYNTRGESLHRNLGISSAQITGIAELQRLSGLVSGGNDTPTAFGSVERELITFSSGATTGLSKYYPSGPYKPGSIATESAGTVISKELSMDGSMITGSSSVTACGSISSGEEVA